MKKHKKIWKTSEFYFISAFILMVLGIIGQLVFLQLLPVKYLIILSIGLLLLFLLIYFLLFSKKINKINKLLGKIICVILTLVFALGNFYIYRGGVTLSDISGAKIKTNAISVIVMKNSDIKEDEIDKLKNGSFGILKLQDRTNTDTAIDTLNEKIGSVIDVEEYDNTFALAAALYDGSVDAIILNEAYRGSFDDNEENKAYKDFDAETRIIYQIEIETELNDISKNVDVTKDPFNVFISGIDTYGSISTSSRSDVNMLVTVNPQTNQILLTSIPRDFYVEQSCQGGQKDKLTHAGIFGVECSVSSIENLFNIDINYYVRVNFTSLIDIVNSLGGITVDNPNGFSAEGYTFEVGNIEMNGDQALTYSRDRNHQEGGDRGRGKSQMRVMTGIIKKAISPSIIINYPSLMNAVSGSFQTNMESKEITKFIQKQLDSMKGWDIIQNSVDGTGGTDWTPANGFNAYVMYPDQQTVDATKSLIQQMMVNQTIE